MRREEWLRFSEDSVLNEIHGPRKVLVLGILLYNSCPWQAEMSICLLLYASTRATMSMDHQFAARKIFQGSVDVDNTRYLSIGFSLPENINQFIALHLVVPRAPVDLEMEG